MKWYYKVQGTHTYVRVFMHGALCGNLVFRNEEFGLICAEATATSSRLIIDFINETARE